MSTRTELYEGALILTDKGPRIVVGLTPTSFVTRGIDGGIEEIDWREVESAREIFEGRVEAVSYSVTASWEGLGTDAKEQALDRQEVVLEILTGYARGHAALARDGEPFWPFDPKDQHSLRGTDAKKGDSVSVMLREQLAL